MSECKRCDELEAMLKRSHEAFNKAVRGSLLGDQAVVKLGDVASEFRAQVRTLALALNKIQSQLRFSPDHFNLRKIAKDALDEAGQERWT